MTIFYFTSTGNSLAVAKRIGGNLISIPQIINETNLHYKDDVIGIVFPIYGFGLPKMVTEFLNKVKIDAKYTFALGTYGNLPGACMMNVQKLALKNGFRFDYAASILMVDNYLPGYKIENQIKKLPEKGIEANLSKIISDINNRKHLHSTSSFGWRIATSIIKSGEKVVMTGKEAQKFIINDTCTKCGICKSVCPTNNISIEDKINFSNKCELCLGCVHHCPTNAIHMKRERSNARWRHPEVSLKEIINSNNTL